MVKKQGEQNQRLAVNVRHVTASDADARLSRVIDILLGSAAKQTKGPKESPNTKEEEPPGQTAFEGGPNGGTENSSDELHP